MKKLIATLAGLSCVLTAVHAAVLDPFTSSDASNYNYLNSYGTSGSALDFAASGGTFGLPALPASNEDVFVLNDSSAQLANVGDSVSLDINLNGVTDGAALGIVLSSSLTPTDIGIQGILLQNVSGEFLVNGGNTSTDSGPQTGYTTLTITKTGATTFSDTATGGGLDLSGTFSFAGPSVYLGLEGYRGDATFVPTAQNFVLTTTPEPSAWALMILGVAALVLIRRVRSQVS